MHSIEILQWSTDRKQGKFVTSNPSIFFSPLAKGEKVSFSKICSRDQTHSGGCFSSEILIIIGMLRQSERYHGGCRT